MFSSPQNRRKNLVSADAKNVSTNFTSANIISSKLYTESTAFYKEYYKSLGEMSFHDLHKTVKRLESKTKYSSKEILTTMQLLTQYANMQSIQKITDVLNKHKISWIGNYKSMAELSADQKILKKNKSFRWALRENFGLNGTLEYIIHEKRHSDLITNNGKIGIFLDENKVKQLEKIKRYNPSKFKKLISNPKYKFFTLSGFDSGISFANREKNIEEETLKFLELSDKTGLSVEELLNRPLKRRIKRLGISPIEIKNEGLPTVNCVYSQMSSEKMTKNDLMNIIRINTEKRFQSINDIHLFDIEKETLQYLKKYLKIYTPETFSKALKELHTKIVEAVEKKGKKEKDIVYVLPNETKSYLPVSYFYSKVNNIRPDKFVNIKGLKNNKNKVFVLIDDCSISGISAEQHINNLEYLLKGNKTDTIFAYVCATDKACEEVAHKPVTMIFQEKLKAHNNSNDRWVYNIVGKNKFNAGNTSTCLVLPYMSPDNNSELASNIAMLHNCIYKRQGQFRKTGDFQGKGGIKTFSPKTREIIDTYNQTIGQTPEVVDVKKNKTTILSFFKKFFNVKND